ncbi:MAG: hypothetical protein MUP21_03255 [Dehalococcoidia bacterium]|nr:hypothetical protein [Dehalococcoidia bacterium]
MSELVIKNIHLGEWEEKRFVERNREMAEMLVSRNYAEFKFKSKVYAGRDHTSVVSTAIWGGLVWVFE